MFVLIIKNLLSPLYKYLLALKKIKFNGKVKLYGFPNISIHRKSKLIIGENVLLNSSNNGYHLNMYSKVKLFIDRPNATIKIGNNTRIHGSCIHAQESITIGDGCLIAANTNIFDSNGHELLMDKPHLRIKSYGKTKPIVLGDNVWIACGCVILPGSIIGDGAVISANSVVSGTVPAGAIFAGNPAKKVERIKN